MEKQTSLSAKIRDMQPGDTIYVPVDGKGMSSVRNRACEYSFHLNREYHVHLDRASRTYIVTRSA